MFKNHNFWVGIVRSYDSFVWKARAIDRILTRHKLWMFVRFAHLMFG